MRDGRGDSARARARRFILVALKESVYLSYRQIEDAVRRAEQEDPYRGSSDYLSETSIRQTLSDMTADGTIQRGGAARAHVWRVPPAADAPGGADHLMPDHPLFIFRATTGRQQAVLDALIEGDWKVVTMPFPGAILLGHPDDDVEIPTPDYAREGRNPMYDFPTYRTLHQLHLTMKATGRFVPATAGRTRQCREVKLTAVLIRECPAPWVQASNRVASLASAAAWVRAPHPATPHRKDVQP